LRPLGRAGGPAAAARLQPGGDAALRSWQTLHVNLTQVAPIVIVAVGMTLVIATGRHRPLGRLADGDRGRAGAADLPETCRGPRAGVALACLVPVAVAAALGWGNGLLVTRFAIQPIVATLVLFIAGRGIAQVMTGGNLRNSGCRNSRSSASAASSACRCR
jgi:ribose transport system permease protein